MTRTQMLNCIGYDDDSKDDEYFGRIYFDDNGEMWVVDLEDESIKMKIEDGFDISAWQAKWKLIGGS